jgi:hypothetical protein
MTRMPPSKFDWIKARHDCSLIVAFKELEEAAKIDVEKVSALPLGNSEVIFKFAGSATGKAFYVTRHGAFIDQTAITFKLNGSSILIKGAGEDMSLTVGVNDFGECKFRLGEEELFQWQVLKKALEAFFFEVKD